MAEKKYIAVDPATDSTSELVKMTNKGNEFYGTFMTTIPGKDEVKDVRHLFVSQVKVDDKEVPSRIDDGIKVSDITEHVRLNSIPVEGMELEFSDWVCEPEQTTDENPLVVQRTDDGQWAVAVDMGDTGLASGLYERITTKKGAWDSIDIQWSGDEISYEGIDTIRIKRAVENLQGYRLGPETGVNEGKVLQPGGENNEPIFAAWKKGKYRNGLAAGENATTEIDDEIQKGAIAFGDDAMALAPGAIQLGTGVNSDESTLQVGEYKLLDSNGKVPNKRLLLDSSLSEFGAPADAGVVGGRISELDSSLSGMVSDERDDRIAADEQLESYLSGLIDDERADRTNADAELDERLTGAIQDEANIREEQYQMLDSSISELSDALEQERTTRAEEISQLDSTLSARIQDEASQRDEADQMIDSALSGLADRVFDIESKVSEDASATNKLADKEWVDDQIDKIAAYYITKHDGSNWASSQELVSGDDGKWYSDGQERTPTRNDYAVVEGEGKASRWVYNGPQTGWVKQYDIETNDYEALDNKPSINDVELTGNKSPSELGLATTQNIDDIYGEMAEIRSDMSLLATKDEVQQVADGLSAANEEIQEIRSDMSSFLTEDDLSEIEAGEITASGITIDGKKPSLEGHTHQMSEVEGLTDEIGELDSTLSSHLADTDNPHNVTPEQIGAVSQEDLEDGLEVDEITAKDITIDGKKPSLEGHTHEIGDISGLGDKLSEVDSTVSQISDKVNDLDSTLSNHLSDDTNPHNVTTEQIGAVSLSELQDGIETEQIEASSLLVDGKKPSLEGHVHEMDEVSGLLDELEQLDSTLSRHLLDTNNPHEVTAQQIGAVTMEELSDGLEVDGIEADNITIDGKKPSLEGHTHDIHDVAGLEDELGQIDSTLSKHLADTNNPHGVTPEQIGAVSHEDLEDGLEVDEISAGDLTINGKKPSLEGHTHVVADITDFPEIPVTSVNTKTGDVVLTSSDINYNDTTTVQQKLSTLDSRITSEQTTRANNDKLKFNSTSVDTAFNNATVYAIGDTCTYEGKWYKCKVDMTTGHNWTDSEWDEMPTVKQFMESQVDALEQELVDGISVDEIEANGITIDGKKPSIEGHEHMVSDITDFPSQIVNSVNGDSGNVTLTGAVIPVDATAGAQNIDAALAGKLNISDRAIHIGLDSSAPTTKRDPIAIGNQAHANMDGTVAIGGKRYSNSTGANATADGAIALGAGAQASAADAVQIGYSSTTNSTANSLRFRDTTVVDGNGKVPTTSLELATLLSGQTFDVTSNTDVQKALGAIITALGGTATNVPTT